jgi:thiol-disulfide isomerase/thioredoxin
MGKILSSILFTAAVGVALGGFFVWWRHNANQRVSSNPILSLDEMEIQGLPRFELPLVSGGNFRLADYPDKIVLVNFWASWCAPCVDEFPSMIRLVNEFPNDLILVAVSRDSNRADIDTFLKAFPGVKTPNIFVVWDESGEVAKSYRVDRLPESFLAKKNFLLSRKIIGTIQWHTPDSVEFIRQLSRESPAPATK